MFHLSMESALEPLPILPAKLGRTFLLILVWMANPSAGSSQTDSPVNLREPAAMVAGQPIYEEELVPVIQAQLQKLRNQEYDLKSKALEHVVTQKLLETEAKKKGIPVENLLTQEVDTKIPEPIDSEIEAYYLGQKGKPNRLPVEMKAQALQSLKNARIQLARDEYLKRLREQYQVVILMRPPKAQISYDSARLRGNPGAQVIIVEFSDFQCPYCRKIQPALKELLAKYEGHVSLAYRDFPLEQMHPGAELAAEASRCAGEQGKFWEYHDLLFADSSKVDHDGLLANARSLKLDEKQFAACLATDKYKEQVDADMLDGLRAGISGTPAFFVNGVFLEGSQSVASFERIIEAELAATAYKSSQD